jgi:tripartite-type tricarboxylate transporter receptor subunit TctC
VVQAISSPDVFKRITSLGQTPVTSTPEEFDGWIRSEFERWGKVVKASGAKAD